METVIGQQAAYNPHLKKVLKTYQLSAVKSLQGPSNVLRTEGLTSVTVTLVPKKEPVSEPSPEPFVTPPPPPIQQLPILTTSDQSRSELSETLLEGEVISCFVVGGEKRLCLPQILNSVLRDFYLPQINQVCDDLQIFCSRCNPEQLEVLKISAILPSSAPSCGLMTQTDAERLCSTLLHQRSTPMPRHLEKKVNFSFKVYHECFGKCKGICMPELFTDGEAKCIQCLECHGFFSPQKFVCHVHARLENRTCHWGFESCKWRSYLLPVEEQQNYDKCMKILKVFKEQHVENSVPAGTGTSGKRKQLSDLLSKCKNSRKDKDDEKLQDNVITKKAKLDDGSNYLQRHHIDAALQQYYCYYDAWASLSSFSRPWPLPLPTDKDIPKSLKDSVPSYLSHEPPVLLHPERVIPHSQSEQFEQSFQPNVALAPPVHKTQDHHPSSIKREIKKERLKEFSCKDTPARTPPNNNNVILPSVPSNHQLELSDTDDSSLVPVNPENELSDSSLDSTSETSLKTGSASRVVDQVAAVLDALSDAKEATRQRVIRLVERLVQHIDKVETEYSNCQEENSQLRNEIETLKQQFDSKPPESSITPPSPASSDQADKQPILRSSPVSVITSSSPIPAVTIKEEPE